LNPQTSPVLILGAGGHGKVVADILLLQNIKAVAFLDDNPDLWGKIYFGLPVLGSIKDFRKHNPRGLVVGIGANEIRKRVVEAIDDDAQSLWMNAIHPNVTLARSSLVGHGVVISSNAVVNPDVVLGNHIIINTAATVDHDCKIEDFAHVAPGAHLAGSIRVEEGVFIGVGASIIPNLTIGRWATIGAGAAVVSSIPAQVTAKGVPAKWS
jgi:sugar O-acyltransferase (sialic acid O-acetyltransferase NeuD family)